jgi:hypothetical protein
LHQLKGKTRAAEVLNLLLNSIWLPKIKIIKIVTLRLHNGSFKGILFSVLAANINNFDEFCPLEFWHFVIRPHFLSKIFGMP